MTTSFDTFLAKEYEAQSEGMKKLYGSFEKFREQYIAGRDFTPWLETLRDREISLGLTNNIVKTYLEFGRRTPEEIPSVLASISRTYNVEIPVVDGILTREYWEEKAKDSHWKITRQE